jgi:hypothetical protein
MTLDDAGTASDIWSAILATMAAGVSVYAWFCSRAGKADPRSIEADGVSFEKTAYCYIKTG